MGHGMALSSLSGILGSEGTVLKTLGNEQVYSVQFSMCYKRKHRGRVQLQTLRLSEYARTFKGGFLLCPDHTFYL